jgi:hypothetical protein
VAAPGPLFLSASRLEAGVEMFADVAVAEITVQRHVSAVGTPVLALSGAFAGASPRVFLWADFSFLVRNRPDAPSRPTLEAQAALALVSRVGLPKKLADT